MKKKTPCTKKQNHTADCQCSFCGQKYNNIPFKSGFVCETCIDYIKEIYADDPSAASSVDKDKK